MNENENSDFSISGFAASSLCETSLTGLADFGATVAVPLRLKPLKFRVSPFSTFARCLGGPPTRNVVSGFTDTMPDLNGGFVGAVWGSATDLSDGRAGERASSILEFFWPACRGGRGESSDVFN